MLDQVTHLFRLKTIIEEGSLRRAAERLNVTQPALSRSVVQLERLFGRQLLERSTRGVQPTAFGRRVLSASLRLMRQWELEEQQLQEDQTVGDIHVRIGAGPESRAVILPEVMPLIQKRFPQLTFEIYRDHHVKAYEDLCEGRLDVVLSGGIGRTDLRLKQRQLAVVVDHIIAREGHPIFERIGPNRLVPDLALLDFPWLVYLEYSTYREMTMHAIHERIGHYPDVRLICDSLQTTIAALQRGDYLAYLPGQIIYAVDAPRLRAVPVDFRWRTTRVGMSIREEIADWEPIQALQDACIETFAKYEPVDYPSTYQNSEDLVGGQW